MHVEHLFFTTAMTSTAFGKLRDAVQDEYVEFCLGQWMYRHYHARDVSVLGRPHSAFLFTTREKYVEFCLKWL